MPDKDIADHRSLSALATESVLLGSLLRSAEESWRSLSTANSKSKSKSKIYSWYKYRLFLSAGDRRSPAR